MKDRNLIDNLKQQIKALASQGKAIHTQIVQLRAEPNTGRERDSLWTSKRLLGRDARIALLAYAYLRGLPYKAVEPKAVSGNIPYASDIARAANPDMPSAWAEAMPFIDPVKAWLKGEPASASSAQPEPSATPSEAA